MPFLPSVLGLFNTLFLTLSLCLPACLSASHCCICLSVSTLYVRGRRQGGGGGELRLPHSGPWFRELACDHLQTLVVRSSGESLGGPQYFGPGVKVHLSGVENDCSFPVVVPALVFSQLRYFLSFIQCENITFSPELY